MLSELTFYMSCFIRKPALYNVCETKDTDQLCNICTADQHLCFHSMDIIIPLLSNLI